MAFGRSKPDPRRLDATRANVGHPGLCRAGLGGGCRRGDHPSRTGSRWKQVGGHGQKLTSKQEARDRPSRARFKRGLPKSGFGTFGPKIEIFTGLPNDDPARSNGRKLLPCSTLCNRTGLQNGDPRMARFSVDRAFLVVTPLLVVRYGLSPYIAFVGPFWHLFA
jgi:hypothetical protein